MQRLFCFILTLVFFVQTNAWAIGTAAPYTTEVMEKLVERYNSLSHEQKIAEIRKSFSTAPEADKKFIEKTLKEMPKAGFLKLKVVKGKIVANNEGQEVSFIQKSPNKISIKGKDIEWKPGQLEQAFKQIEKLLTTQEVSIMDLFISPAYAVAPIVAIYGMLLAIAAGCAAVGAAVYFFGDEKDLKKICQSALSKLEESGATGSLSEHEEVSKQVAKSRESLDKNAKCSDFKYLETYKMCSNLSEKDASKVDACKTGELKDYKFCLEARACLAQISYELDSKAASTNNSDRGEIKDVTPARPAKNQKESTATQQ